MACSPDCLIGRHVVGLAKNHAKSKVPLRLTSAEAAARWSVALGLGSARSAGQRPCPTTRPSGYTQSQPLRICETAAARNPSLISYPQSSFARGLNRGARPEEIPGRNATIGSSRAQPPVLSSNWGSPMIANRRRQGEAACRRDSHPRPATQESPTPPGDRDCYAHGVSAQSGPAAASARVNVPIPDRV